MAINDSLGQLLNEIKFSHEHTEEISAIVEKIRDLKKQLAMAERELAQSVDSLYAQLATSVRRLQPNIGVSLQKHGCVVGYRTKCITCTANPHTGKWDFAPGDFGRIFASKFGNYTMETPLDDIAKSLVDFFGSHYKSLAIAQ